MSALSGKTRFIGLLVIGLLALGALVAGGMASQAGVPSGVILGSTVGKITQEVLDNTERGQSTSFVILLSEQADVSKAYSIRNEDERGWYVYNTLRSVAETSQASIKAFLAQNGVSYQSYWAANMLIASGNRSVVESVAARSDVRAIESNAPHRWIEDESIANTSLAPVSPLAPEWGVQNVNAPAVWAMGFTGQGIVIGNQDTGMRWSHNALKPQYRGWNGTTADHNYNWHDSIHSGGGSCGPNTLAPCDDYGHGTHTTGTTAGYDGGSNQVGVAPGAKWIGCRNMNVGAGTPATYTECFQFFLAPTDLNGLNPNPALRPHVMNNSWGCPTSEGCAAGTLQSIVESSQAAGIFVEVSAGNSGPGCSSVNDPPAIYAASFSTGAIDIGNVLASFSSRGPVTVDGSNRMKPNISGPGVNVRSSTPGNDNEYGNSSGTSMAGPHVVGVVALLWSAHPELSRMITETKTLLQDTANPNVVVTPVQTCGGIPSTQIPNNSFGYGRVDALAAVNAAGGGTTTPTAVAATATRTNTAVVPTATNTAVAATATRTNTSVAATATRTNTSGVPTASNTSVAGTATNTAVAATATNTAVGATATDTPVIEPTATDTPVVEPTATDTPVEPTATYTPGILPPTETNTPVEPSATDTPVEPSATPTECVMHFSDVASGDTFYEYIKWMFCNGVITGYNDGTFRPNNPATRGQLSKMITLAFNLATDTTGGPHFNDVASGSTFYDYVETLFNAGAINGYPCGGPGEPCGTGSLPYFRPNNSVTRGQLSKIVVLGGGYDIDTTGGPHFADVASGSTFYPHIETLFNLGAINGYPCGGPGEPCGTGSLPYFRPNATTTRGQLSKVVVICVTEHPPLAR